MMLPLLVSALLAVQAPCPSEDRQRLEAAEARLLALDLEGAASALRAAPPGACRDVEVAALYLRGIVAARDAFREGAPAGSLMPVRDAAGALDAIAGGVPGPAEIARLLLHAAAAGAQSERAEMALYLDTAARMEALQRAAGEPGAPLVGSLELAGDLWLQLFEYAEAHRAYTQALEEGSGSLRVVAGLARAAARLGNDTEACDRYRTLLARWAAGSGEPSEIADARAYLEGPECRPGR